MVFIFLSVFLFSAHYAKKDARLKFQPPPSPNLKKEKGFFFSFLLDLRRHRYPPITSVASAIARCDLSDYATPIDISASSHRAIADASEVTRAM
jgi:hypothetical protein